MKKTMLSLLSVSLCLPLAAFSLNLKNGMIPIEGGVFASSVGEAQHIGIQGLVGNQYTANTNHATNGLVGVGYFLEGLDKERFKLSYGVNAFYLGNMSVQGLIAEEHFVNNLSYSYNIANLPVYLAGKATIKSKSEAYNFFVDAGIGPNFMRTSHYHETPLNNFSMPNSFFSEKNTVAFSAMAGVGLRVNNVFGTRPLTCGYRFFYLGKGEMQRNNSALLNTLETGTAFANAVTCGVVI